MKPKTRVLIVCLGNICRSPMAEGVLRDLAAKRGLAVEVDSAGTANYHVGEPPDNRAIKEMLARGIDITSLRARQFVASDYLQFDHILAMDSNNLHNILALCPNEELTSKVRLILPDNASVPDPYYGSQEDFALVYKMLNHACDEFLTRI